MSRLFNTTVFNDVIAATGAVTVYTDPKHDELLGSADAISVQAIADQIVGTSPTLTIVSEHSGDRKAWSARTTLFGATAIANQTIITGNDPGATPSLGFVRLKITLSAASAPSSRVQVFVCGRSL